MFEQFESFTKIANAILIQVKCYADVAAHFAFKLSRNLINVSVDVWMEKLLENSKFKKFCSKLYKISCI